MSVVSDVARVAPAPAVRALLREAIDYAGLFPPSEVPLRDAAANYASYRAGPDGWMLGNFVVPVGRLEELAAVKHGGTSNIEHRTSNVEGEGRATRDQRAGTRDFGTASARQTPYGEGVNGDWPVSAVLGPEPLKDLEAVGAFNARWQANRRDEGVASPVGLRVTAVEARVRSAAEAVRLATAVPKEIALWVEFTERPPEIPRELAAPNRGAKIRTGGVTPGSFPAAADVAAFILACQRAGVRFKATAGLHHPLTGEYPLTDARGSERVRMFGFLNVLLAAAAVVGRDLPIPPRETRPGGDVQTRMVSQDEAEEAEERGEGLEGLGRPAANLKQLVAILECTDPKAFSVEGDWIAWRGQRFSVHGLREGRAFIASFGSCSFTEPVEALKEMGWL